MEWVRRVNGEGEGGLMGMRNEVKWGGGRMLIWEGEASKWEGAGGGETRLKREGEGG